MKKILIPRLQNRFIELVDIYLQKHHINQKQLVNLVGIPESHLSALKPNASRQSKRILSMNYVFKFIKKGVFCTDDIYDGNVESDREREWWELAKLIEKKPLLEKIAYAQKLGLDIDTFLDGYIYSPERRNDNLQ